MSMVVAEKNASLVESLFVRSDLLSEAQFIAKNAKDELKSLELLLRPPDGQT